MNTNILSTFKDDLKVVVIGASGAIGRAFVESLTVQQNVSLVYGLSRSLKQFNHPKVRQYPIDITSSTSVELAINQIKDYGPFDLIIIATGLLHTQTLQPEKNLRDIKIENFEEVFRVNFFGPALVAKNLLPFISRDTKSVVAFMSARVGSISDNHLGGWYAYRSSKAALNMMIKNLSIELSRRYKNACIVGLHPGTVNSPLSKPFQSHVDPAKLFSAKYAVECLLTVINNTSVSDSGSIFAWNGEKIPE